LRTSASIPTDDVQVHTEGTVGIVTVNRPDRLNAMDPAMCDRLRLAFLAFESDPNLRAVVLTGAGRGFCAGADISGNPGQSGNALGDHWNPLVRTTHSLFIDLAGGTSLAFQRGDRRWGGWCPIGLPEREGPAFSAFDEIAEWTDKSGEIACGLSEYGQIRYIH
jgi:hypothetical protein